MPVRGGGDDQRALALADRRDDIDDARGHVLAGRVIDLELQPLVGIKRRQVVEIDLVADLFRVLEIDRVDLEQREIALALLGAADHALDGVAGAQAEAADLRGRDIDIVGTRQIIGVGRAQEAEAVLQHLDDAFADDLDVAAGKFLRIANISSCLRMRRGVLDLVLLGESQQLGRRLGFEVLQFDHPRRRGVLGAFFGNVLNCHVFISIGRMARAGSGKDEELGRISRSALAASAIWP